MSKKITLTITGILLTFFTCIFLFNFSFQSPALGDSDDYVLTLTHISSKDLSYGQTTLTTSSGNPITFSFTNTVESSDGVIRLGKDGTFKNDTKISGIKKINGILSSPVELRYGNDENLDYGSTTLNVAFDYELDFPSDYFAISTSKDTLITSLTITYSCYSSDKPIIDDGVHSLSYEFKGNEMELKGYAEGRVTLSHLTGFSKGDEYRFFWGDNSKKLDNMYPLYSKVIDAIGNKLFFDINENVSIPSDATSLIVYKGEEIVALYPIPTYKLANDEIVYKSATISDVHMNYQQGEKHLLEALNRFEDEGVEYIIITGDIGETTKDFNKYISACTSSKYSGLIFSCPGNHDQRSSDSITLYDQVAMYDGSATKFIDIKNGPSYFASSYKGSLPVKVTYLDVEGDNNTHYYYASIADNLYFFSDMTVLNANGDDRFSKKQLDYLESVLYTYSGSHKGDEAFDYDEYNIYIVEHAPFKKFKVGDTYLPKYGGQLEIAPSLVNNSRFELLLKEYSEAIMLTGHTHVKFETGINFVDKYYDLHGNLTDTPFARTFHVSSLAMPRWYEDNRMTTHDNFTAMSEGYIVYQYNDRTVYEGTCFKEYTPSNKAYDPSLFGLTTYSKESYVFPKLTSSHSSITDYSDPTYISVNEGSPTVNDLGESIQISFTLSDSVNFDLGNLDIALAKEESLYFLIEGDDKTFTVSGIDSDNSVIKSIEIDLDAVGDKYHYSEDGSKYLLQVQVKDLFIDKLSNYKVKLSNYVGELTLNSLRIKQTYDVTTRGIKSFAPSIDTSIMFKDTTYTSLQFDYRIENGTKFSMCFMSDDWQSYFGYFDFNKDGATSSYTGVTTQKLKDGYVRVNIDFSTCTKKGSPINVDRFYVRGAVSNASGYIDNIVLIEGEITPPVDPATNRGESFSDGSDGNFRLTQVKDATHLTFEYRIDSGTKINICIFNEINWHYYYGYYEFTKSGTAANYNGISFEKLEDGYIKVTMVLANLNHTHGDGFPTPPINYFYLRGAWSDASGYIDNIVLENRGEVVPRRGDAFTAGVNFTKQFATNSYSTITFEYIIESGDHFNMMIANMSDWEHHYGYYEFNSNGAKTTYDGISTLLLEDGYIRVTMNYKELNKTGSQGAPTIDPGLFYIRDNGDASGYVDNIVFSL